MAKKKDPKEVSKTTGSMLVPPPIPKYFLEREGIETNIGLLNYSNYLSLTECLSGDVRPSYINTMARSASTETILRLRRAMLIQADKE